MENKDNEIKFIQGDGWFYCNDEIGKAYQREKVKKWYSENNEYKKDYLKIYYEENKDKMYSCEKCKCQIKFLYKSKHNKSKKHLKNLEN